MKLFIDDIRRAPDGWEVARNVTDAIRILATQGDKIDEISIDHDASHGLSENTGMEVSCPCDFTAVAYFIAECFIPDSFKITIHSANPDGIKRIKNILDDAEMESEIKPYEYPV